MAESSFLIGQTVSHYRIVDKIGVGGMGEVYRASDTKLGRDVALKVLPADTARDPDRLARFEREARSVAALNHPHIVTLHSVEEADGVHFLTMELVEGRSLDHLIPAGGMGVEQILRVATAIADALCAAHEKGIVHRDLKPANVMMTQDGRVKVLDFGLAKATQPGQPNDATLTSAGYTQAGVVMGTPAYMSPEQISGSEVDHRTDIFSLGVMLYEMSTGQRPFHGRSPAELASATLRDTPQLVTDLRTELPGDLSRIIRRCLEKDLRYRVQTARDVVNEIRDLTGTLRTSSATSASPPVDSGPSVAVLPFQNLSADPENEYFSEGLAEEILNALSQVKGLNVAARTSSFYFKNKATEMSEIASKLRVANVLEGSVRRAGNRVRVTVQLVEVKTGFHLWSERYDRQMEDIFEVQDEIARAITERLKVTLAGGSKRPTDNVEAYELYLKGLYHWHQRSPSTLRVAIQCFEQAIKLDSHYALAYAGLADCYGILRFYGWISAEAGQPPAHAAMTQAMNLAPSLWEVNFSRAFYAFYFERAWHEAGPHFEKAIAIHPRSSLAHVYNALFLTSAGRLDEAVTHAKQAAQLDPLSPIVHCLGSSTLLSMGRFAESQSLVQKALELQPDYLFGHWVRGLVLCGLDRANEAIESFERAATLSRAPIFLGMLGFGYGRAGCTEDANRLLRELEDRGSRGEYVPAFAPLCIYLGMGNVSEIRRTFASAIEEAVPPLTVRVTGGHFLEAFRSDPQIDKLHRELFGW
ncbi:MAG TPA: protein kinase [Candidatus Limnocylindrales bacterium]|nr:protein kinase [Candidatus Limnocylindrales bacterium]